MACSVKYCYFCNEILKERIVIKRVQLLINVVKEKKNHVKTGVSSTVLVFLGEVWSSPPLILTVYSLTLTNLEFSCMILSINETKLDSSVHDSDAYIPGFEIVKRNRKVNGRKGGGVCTYLRTNLNYRIRDDLINDDLECLIVEISKPRSSVFLVDTWYRPPNSPPKRFNEFENVIDKIHAESKELYILGDINCNLLPEASAHISSYLTNIFDIYGLSQLITEPTRITPVSKTLIDLCITNSPEKVSNSGVIHLWDQ